MSLSENAAKLQEILPKLAPVESTDTPDELEIFGCLYSAKQVSTALEETKRYQVNVGLPTSDASITLIQSKVFPPATFLNDALEKITPHQVAVEFENTTDALLRVRWITEEGGTLSSHQWDIAKGSIMRQYAIPGHLFLLSLATPSQSLFDTQDEQLVGAYRPKRATSTETPHRIRLDDHDSKKKFRLAFCLQDLWDQMTLAAADIDPIGCTTEEKHSLKQTISFLQTILQNILKHPDEERYHKLRRSNAKIERTMARYWGAQQFLRLVGFQDEKIGGEDYWVVSTPTADHFIADLALPTPWQRTTVTTGKGWTSARSGFLSEDEKWARAERVAGLRRSGRARRPEPGEAPSSRGNWGR